MVEAKPRCRYRLTFHKPDRVTAELATYHAPAGYSKNKPLIFQGHRFVGGQFIPNELVQSMPESMRQKLEKRSDLFDEPEQTETPSAEQVADIYKTAGQWTTKNSQINEALQAIAGMDKNAAADVIKKLGWRVAGDARDQLANAIIDRRGSQIRSLNSGASREWVAARRAEAEPALDEPLLDWDKLKKGGEKGLVPPSKPEPVEKPPAEKFAEFYEIQPGDLKRINGFAVRRTGANEFRLEKEDGKGYVSGPPKELKEYIERQTSYQGHYGRKLKEAIDRAANFEEPPWTDAEYHAKAAKAFAALPSGTPVVSLDDYAGTKGRTGRVVRDEFGRNRVKLDGEDGYASNDVEPLDAALSWRKAPGEQAAPAEPKPKQGGLFDQPAEPEEGKASEQQLKDFVEEEKKGAKKYEELGYPEQAADEEKHAGFFENQLKGEKKEEKPESREEEEPVPQSPKGFNGSSHAADELQSIRNDLAGGHADMKELKDRVDAVGKWAAEQKNQTPSIRKVLQEAHQLADKLAGGSGKGGNRIEITKSPAPQGPSINVAKQKLVDAGAEREDVDDAFSDAQKLGIDAARFDNLESLQEAIREVEEKELNQPIEDVGKPSAPQPEKSKKPAAVGVSLAHELQKELDAGNKIDSRKLFEIADKAYGGTRAQGVYGPSDAYDALEAAFNQSLRGKTDPKADLASAQQQAKDIANKVGQLPTQTNRSGNKDSFQQFSTPPHYAFAAAWAANIKPGDVVFEPSAGTGCLAIQAENAGGDVYANELDPRRAEYLINQLGADHVSIGPAEHVSAMLPKQGVPNPEVIVMNPPFSATAGRTNTKDLMTGANHIEEAMRMLKDGGRLVSIVGRGMDINSHTFRDWFKRMQEKYNLRANVAVAGGEYAKYGTHFGTRLLIFDKTGPTTGDPVTGLAEDIPDLMAKLAEVRDDRPERPEQNAGVPAGQEGAQRNEGAARPGPEPAGGAAPGVAGEGERAGLPGRPSGMPLHDVGTRGDSDQALPEQPDTVPGNAPKAPRSGGRGAGGPSGRAGKSNAKPKRGVSGKPSGDQSGLELSPDGPKLREPERLKVENKPAESPSEDESAGLYTKYRPAKVHIEGMQPHMSPLVESSAMAAIQPPDPTYQPVLSPDLISSGVLSDALLENLVYFGQAHSTYLPANPGQTAMRRAAMTGDGTGCGKAQPLDAKILTPDGWRTMGEMGVGVEIIGGDGSVTRVIGVYPQGEQDVYRVTFSDGSCTECTDEHLWFTQTWNDRRNSARGPKWYGSVKELREIAKTLLHTGGQANHSIPMVGVVQFQKQSVEIDPYVLGVLIGDGGMSRPTSTTLTSADQEIIGAVGERLGAGIALRHRTRYDYSISKATGPRNAKNVFLDALRNLGLHGSGKTAATKFVPDAYKFNSVEVRHAILQGLLDTDGTVSRNGIRVAFYTTSPRLADDVIFLVRSLGGITRTSIKEPHYTHNGENRIGRHCFVVSVCLPPHFAPFRLKRKADLVVPKTKYRPARYIKRVEFIGRKPCQCIAVENPSHLYVTDDFIVTHNTRQWLAAMWDNTNQGRKRHIVITKSSDLTAQFKDEMRKIGWNPDLIKPFDYDALSAGRGPEEGIMFISYSMLRSGPDNIEMPRNVDVLKKWLGPDFDGVVAFDESHLMANSLEKDPLSASEGTIRGGSSGASEQALAGMSLIRGMPNARLIFASATGASKLQNLAYCGERLGIWGTGTGFANAEDFMTEMQKGGVAALEAVAQHLKASGLYSSRSLSYQGVTRGTVAHKLTPEQRHNYDKLSEGWRMVFGRVAEALNLTGGAKNGLAVMRAMGQFQTAQQSFFNQVLTSMMVPSAIKQIQDDLDKGMSPVIQVYNTLGQAGEAQIKDAEARGQSLDTLDLSPKQILKNYINNAFPTHRYEEYTDENGNTQTRPVIDYSDAKRGWDAFIAEYRPDSPEAEQIEIRRKHGVPTSASFKDINAAKKKYFEERGEPLEDPEAVAKRDALLEEIESYRIPEMAIDQILSHFGHDRVAEVTGRKLRLVPSEEGGEPVKHKMGSGFAVSEVRAFQDGKKDILIFSMKKAGTGFDLHADKGAGNSKRRSHHLLQLGWKADDAVQAFGRTNRTNQTEPPHYWNYEVPEVPGQKRFSEIVKARLEALMSLSRGSRKTGKDILNDGVDINSPQGGAALNLFKENILNHRYEDLSRADFVKMFALSPVGGKDAVAIQEKEDDNLRNMTMNQFLNKMLAVPLARQTEVFAKYADILDRVIAQARNDGTLGVGTEDYDGEISKTISNNPIYRDPETGVEAKHLVVVVRRKNTPTPWEKVDEVQKSNPDHRGYYRNDQSGKLWAVEWWPHKTDPKNGNIIERVRLVSPGSEKVIPASDLNNFSKVSESTARSEWDAEFKTIPEYSEREEHFVSGAMLPIWKKLPTVEQQPPRIYRLNVEGKNVVARHIPRSKIEEFRRNMGLGAGPAAKPAEVHAQLEAGNISAKLDNGWTLKPVRYGHERRIELIGPSSFYWDDLMAKGAIKERGSDYKTRLFIPTGPAGVQVLERLAKENKIVAQIPTSGGTTELSTRSAPAPRVRIRFH